MRKIGLRCSETTKYCNPLYFKLCYPSCVEVIVEKFVLVVIPLSVEVIEIGVLAMCLSL